MKSLMKKVNTKAIFFSIAVFALLLVGANFLRSSYSLNEPIRTITFGSEKLNYDTKDAGSVKINKSAEWTSPGKARITLDANTIAKKDAAHTDVIFVLDNSESMRYSKMDQVKKDATELINKLFEDNDSHAALITFNTASTLVSDFTNDKNSLINSISSIEVSSLTNYYQALLNVEKILKNYTRKEDTECVVLFLTDGFPNSGTPNEVGLYQYLKSTYPYVVFNAIQYEMGVSIYEEVRRISDYQYVADMETLNNTLFQAYTVPSPYENLIITDYINNDYFNIDSVSSITPSAGTVRLEEENGVPKVIWDLSGVRGGSRHSLTIDINLKEEHRNQEELYPTNKKEILTYKIGQDSETVEKTDTPILKGQYQVIYEGNQPEGCIVNGVPDRMNLKPKENVAISKTIPTCEGYQFKEWRIVTNGVNSPSDGVFIMPENDVVIRAVWNKLEIEKSMDGVVYTQAPPALQSIYWGYAEKLWKYRTSITKIVFENQIHEVSGASDSWDLSAEADGRVMGYLVGSTAYIQANGKIYASPDCTYLFYGFNNLVSMEGMEYFDTSNVTTMKCMFNNCNNLANIDFSYFDTSKVTNMDGMFYNDKKLVTLDLGSFNTENVTSMYQTFCNCEGLVTLNVSSFNTSKVTNMGHLFYFDYNLANVNLTGFDMSNVTNVAYMFDSCYKIKGSINFNFKKAPSYESVFGETAKTSGSFIVNYTAANSSLVDTMISSSWKNNARKGSLIA